jgi:hypothetical protein
MTQTEKRIIHEKLTKFQVHLDKRFQFFIENQQYFKGTRVKNNRISSYRRLSKSIANILKHIDYTPTRK